MGTSDPQRVETILGTYGKEMSLVVSVLRLRRNVHWQEDASLDSLLSRAGLWQLGKGWIVRDTTTRTTRLAGSSTRTGTGCTDLQ